MRLPRLACASLLLLVAAGCEDARPRPSPTPSGSPGERVAIDTPDGARLRGWLFGSGKTAVVMAHMFPSDASSWFGTARKLAETGYTALAIDFRYRSSGRTEEAAKASLDLRAAYDFAKGRGAERVALVGASMGGTAALIVASEADTPAVVAISAPTRFRGLDAEAAAPKVAAPVLLLASSGDDEAARSLRTLSGLLPNDNPLLYDGDAHGTNLLMTRPSSEEEVIRFLTTNAPV